MDDPLRLVNSGGGNSRRWHGRWHGIAIAAMPRTPTYVVADAIHDYSLACDFAASVDIRSRIEVFKTGEAGGPNWSPWLLGDNVIVVITNQTQNSPPGRPVGLEAAALVACYTLALLAAALFAFRRRDIA